VGFALAGHPVPAGLEDAVVLAEGPRVLAAFSLDERPRTGAAAALAELAHAGIAVEIASGDSPARVAAMAWRLGVAEWRARLRPEDKLARLAQLRATGARVMAIGDGINDAPVLAGADVAVALAGGADLAQAASDIVLAGARLGALAEARATARETLRVLRHNQRWALAYNLVAVPFAAAGMVPPWLAAIGMSASSLGVVLNALRIGRDAPAHAPAPAAQEAPA
jgi:Cu2+-exporting ATPase